MISCEGGDDVAEKAVSDFNFFSAHDKDTDNPTIKRTFILSNKDHPEAPSHKITQMQCVSWPDFDVPSSPSTLLALVKDVDAAVAASAEEAEIREGQPPVLVHCEVQLARFRIFLATDQSSALNL
jgi:protein tyrosine phosphatase